jgi:tripartite-type tricarboxylate transporter receptor subunit TctC
MSSSHCKISSHLKRLSNSLFLATVLLVCANNAARPEYPARPVKIIVPVAPGGGTDIMARLLAHTLSERLGQQFIVENRPGAGGIVGAKSVTTARPDGLTLLYAPAALALSVITSKTPPYDLATDFTPIVNTAINPAVLVVHPSVRARTLTEFIAYGRAHSGKLSYGSPGVGTASHFAGELLKADAGFDMVHVPNRGMTPSLNDLLSGQVQVLFAGTTSVVSEGTGRMRPIAIAEMQRSGLLPDLPTMDESGLPGFEVGNWAGLLGPAGLDPAIVRKLNGEILAILGTPSVRERAKIMGFDIVGSTPEKLATQLQEDIRRWSRIADFVRKDQ